MKRPTRVLCNVMTLDQAIATLRRHQSQLEAHGIKHAAVFGSVARNEAKPDSDLDILVDLDPSLKLDVFGYVGLKRYVAELFPGRVDVVNRATLKPRAKASALRDSINAF